MDTGRNPTEETFGAFDTIYQEINETLFAAQLRPCLITFQRLRKAYGCFAGARYMSRDEADIADAIILDGRSWGPKRPDAEKLSTIGHEMVHVWQHHHGKSGRSGYHNKQFARKMWEIGLVTSDTGQQGGRSTGHKMSHYILPDGRFDRLCQRLLGGGLALPYFERTDGNDKGLMRRKASKAESKSPYVCAECDPPVRVWGKPSLQLICKACETDFVPEKPIIEDDWPI